MLLISMREFARRNGVSHVAIRKAVKTGRLPKTNGKIDVEVAQPIWDRVKGPRAGHRIVAPKVQTRTCRLVEGEVTLRLPYPLSPASFHQFAQWIDAVKGRMAFVMGEKLCR